MDDRSTRGGGPNLVVRLAGLLTRRNEQAPAAPAVLWLAWIAGFHSASADDGALLEIEKRGAGPNTRIIESGVPKAYLRDIVRPAAAAGVISKDELREWTRELRDYRIYDPRVSAFANGYESRCDGLAATACGQYIAHGRSRGGSCDTWALMSPAAKRPVRRSRTRLGTGPSRQAGVRKA